MSQAQNPNAYSEHNPGPPTNGINGKDRGGSRYDYGGNPLAREMTMEEGARMFQAFGGNLQPGAYMQKKSNLANPAPLGLSAFALTTFLLSLINMGTRGTATPNIVVAVAFGYGESTVLGCFIP